jgi:hypothetical protein
VWGREEEEEGSSLKEEMETRQRWKSEKERRVD